MKPKGSYIAEGHFSASQAVDTTRVLEAKNSTYTPLKYRFQWEKVNEVTFKLTTGELTNVPASHGKWGNYRTTKAIAWVICMAPGRWLARCGNRACGPSSFNDAKGDAFAMAKGGHGDYLVENPINHLNGLAARLLGRDGGES